MSINEEFEAFAKKFNKRFGYLPLDKDDICRPNVEQSPVGNRKI
jgi:hypothetical protein